MFGCPVYAYRILAYEPAVGRSHWNVISAVLESLVDASHEVVCATMHPATDRLAGHSNYTHVDISSLFGGMPMGSGRDLSLTGIRTAFRYNGFLVGFMTNRAQRICALLHEVPAIRDAVDGVGERFDAVVMESTYSECQRILLPDRLRLPVVYVVPSPPVNWMPAATGSPDHPSYLGTLLTARPTPGNFVQRLSNAVDYAYTNVIRWYRDAGTRYGDRWEPDPGTGSMVFVNTHHSVEPARPLGPNVLEIGGIHLRRPPESLPRDLAEVMDKNDEFGVIVFTFGSFVAMNSLPENVLDILKFTLSRLPQTVIWKYEDDHMNNKPENVLLQKWLPQRDLLHHPNVKLFISHGGMSGLYETVEAGVPVLGVPLFYDQPRNVQNLVDLGMALSLNIDDMDRSKILSAIDKLLKDQSFSENAKRVSSIFRDRPMKPADAVVYWTEYLIRHGNESNISPQAANASWISHFMIDLLAVLVATVLALWFCWRIIVKR